MLPTDWIGLINLLLKLGAEGYKYIGKVRTIAAQDARWTPEHEAEVDALIESKGMDPYWKPDPPGGTA